MSIPANLNQTLLLNIIEAKRDEPRYKINNMQDLGALLITWCERVGKNPQTTTLRVTRTGRDITLFDAGTMACECLLDGDVLEEVA